MEWLHIMKSLYKIFCVVLVLILLLCACWEETVFDNPLHSIYIENSEGKEF